MVFLLPLMLLVFMVMVGVVRAFGFPAISAKTDMLSRQAARQSRFKMLSAAKNTERRATRPFHGEEDSTDET